MPDHSVRYKNFFVIGDTWENPADPNPVVLGMNYRFEVAGEILGVKYLRTAGTELGHMAFVQDSANGYIYRAAAFKQFSMGALDSPRWESVYFGRKLEVFEDDVFVIALWSKNGNYSRILNFLSGGSVTRGNITLLNFDSTHPAGIFTYNADLDPGASYMSSAYAVDVIFKEA